MPNEILWILMMLLNFGAITLLYRFFGRIGLFIWIPIAAVVANIQVLKTVDLFGIAATLGNIVYATSFLVTDILSENYGKKSARNAVFFGFFTLIVVTLLMNLAIFFAPNSFDSSQSHIEAIFGFFPALVVASLTAFGISQLHDIWSYNIWKTFRPDPRFIWLRNNLSTMVSQLLDSLIFTLIATAFGVFPWEEFLVLFASTYVLKFVVAIADTPFIYLASWLKRSGKVRELETLLSEESPKPAV
jgi:uncharacterized integral membrane protein (TIGR00697 family)